MKSTFCSSAPHLSPADLCLSPIFSLPLKPLSKSSINVNPFQGLSRDLTKISLRRLIAGYGFWLATINAGWAASAPQDMRESTSELVYNFALLSQTPNRPSQEAYNICAFEEDLAYLLPTRLETQKIQNSQIFLLPLKALADVKRCNLLYIQDFMLQKPLELQQLIQKEAVLTVVHAGNKFSDYGHVIINAQDKRYQFDLRIQPAKQAGIVFDARLMKLATNIIND